MNKIINLLSGWLSRSGDDTFWSWVITLTYAVTIVISLYSLYRLRGQKTRLLLWSYISVFIVIMGINKQLDIQILVIMAGRIITGKLNLAAYGGTIHLIVAAGLFAVLTGFTIFVIYKTRSVLRQSLVAISGIAILIIFVLIRALSVYIYKVHGIELLGIGLILVDRIIFLRRLQAPR